MNVVRTLTVSIAALCLLLALAAPGVCSPKFNIDALKAQAAKVVPSGYDNISEDTDDLSSFLAYTKGESAYQFTLSGDMDPQMPDAETFTYKGKKAFFFTPGLDSSGAVMVILKPEAESLTVIHSLGFSSDKDITRADMEAILDKMDLDAL